MNIFKDSALPLILIFEGKFSNNPNDKGKATNFGITQKTYDYFRKAKSLPLQNVSNISTIELEDIYESFYWIPCKCDLMPSNIAIIVFDTAIQSGQSKAIKFLQECLKIKIDGIIGSQTINKLKEINEIDILNFYINLRETYYKSIVLKDPSQEVFLKGWLRRLNFIKDYLFDIKTLEDIKKSW